MTVHSRLLLLGFLLVSACAETGDKAGADTGPHGATTTPGETDIDDPPDTQDEAPDVVCVARFPFPRTVAVGAPADISVVLDCEDPAIAAQSQWTAAWLDGSTAEAVVVGEEPVEVAVSLREDQLSEVSQRGVLTLLPESGSPVPVDLRVHAPSDGPSGPPAVGVGVGALDLSRAFALSPFATESGSLGGFYAAQIGADDAFFAGVLGLAGTACAEGACVGSLPIEFTPVGYSMVGNELVVLGNNAEGKVQGAAWTLMPDGEVKDVDPSGFATQVSGMNAIGTLVAVHHIVRTPPPRTGEPSGVAVLATVRNARGDYLVWSMFGTAGVLGGEHGISTADIESGKASLAFAAEVDLRGAPGKELQVLSINLAELEPDTCTLPVTTWDFSGSDLKKNRVRRLTDVCTGLQGYAVVTRVFDVDGAALDAVLLPTASGDQLFLGAADTSDLLPLDFGGVPVFGPDPQGGVPGQPDPGMYLTSNGNKGKILTSDGLEYDRTAVTGAAVVGLNGSAATGIRASGGASLGIKLPGKSTPILYLVPGTGGGTSDPLDPQLYAGDDLSVWARDGRLVVGRLEHMDAPLGAWGPIAAVGGGADRLGVVIGLNTTKESDPPELTSSRTVPVSGTSTITFTDTTLEIRGGDFQFYDTSFVSSRPQGCTLSGDALTCWEMETEPVDSFRVYPSDEGEGLVGLVRRGASIGFVTLNEVRDAQQLMGDGAPDLSGILPRTEPAGVAIDNPIFAPPVGEVTNVLANGSALPPATSTGIVADAVSAGVLTTAGDGGPCDVGLYYFANPSDGPLEPSASSLIASGSGDCSDLPIALVMADMLGVGQSQAVLWSAKTGLELFWVDALGKWRRHPLFSLPGDERPHVSAADIDGDGLDDLFVRQPDQGAWMLQSDGWGSVVDLAWDAADLAAIDGLPGPAPAWPQRVDGQVLWSRGLDVR